MFSPPSILCSCKVMRCSVCMRCSRCGCAHDGIPVEQKLQRRRGRAPRARDGITFRTSDENDGAENRDTNCAADSNGSDVGSSSSVVKFCRSRRRLIDDEDFKWEGITAESSGDIERITSVASSKPEKPRLDGRPRRVASRKTLPVEHKSPGERELPEYQDLLRFLGFEPRTVQNWSKNLGHASVRLMADLWKDDKANSRTKSTVFCIFREAFLAVAESVCGGEAGAASLSAFNRKEHSKGNVLSLPAEEASHIFRLLAAGMTATKRYSVEQRIVRAILCGLFSKGELSNMAEFFPGFRMGKDAYSSGSRDLEILLVEGVLDKNAWSRERFDRVIVDGAIQFIMAYDNVVYLSWGTKTIVLDSKQYIVPAILRRKPISVMWRNYSQESAPSQIPPQTEPSQVSRRTFYRLCRVLTHGETNMRAAVDYVSGLLVNDNMHTLKRIVSDLIPGEKDDLIPCLDTLRSWLKYGSFAAAPLLEGDQEFSAVDECPRHDTHFGLTPARGRDPLQDRKVCCGPCSGMNALLNHIVEMVKTNEEADARTLSVVHDCFEKIELFMGHRLRVVHQQRTLAKVLHDMSTRSTQGGEIYEAYVTIDFKMKAEPIYFREKTLEHYGKRGMSWHGAMIQFWADENGGNSSTKRITEEKLYYNHISAADNRQDKDAVVALVEAVLIDIKRDLPQIDRIVVQSDNASSYQNSFLAVLLPILGIANGIEVARFLHTETQDGKSLLDAQFARGSRKVKTWVRQGNDCTTPRSLVTALISDEGLPNTMAEIVEYDREALRHLANEIKPVEKAFARYSGRLNDIRYGYDNFPGRNRDRGAESAFDLRDCPKVIVRAFTYSDIGAGVLMELDPKAGTCKRSTDDEREQDADSEAQRDGRSEGLSRGDDDAEVGGGDAEEMNAINDEDYYNANIAGSLCSEADDADADSDAESGDEDERDLSSEIVLPRCVIGRVTSVRVTTEAQIRRRLNTWKCSRGAVADLPTTRKKSREKEKSVVAYAKKNLVDMKNAGSLAVAEVSDLPQRMMAMLDRFVGEVPAPTLRQGWAQRPAYGTMYGAKYISRYMKEVTEMFKRGADNKSDKMGPARMVETLLLNHPKRYDIPGESEVRTAISKFCLQASENGQQLLAMTPFNHHKKNSSGWSDDTSIS